MLRRRRFCTVVEVGFLHGVSGYGGKCNWFADKNEASPLLDKVMPDSLKKPYDESLSEVRMTDVPMRNKDPHACQRERAPCRPTTLLA